MQFSEILKLQSDSESESFSDGQSFLNKLEGPGLDDFSCDLRIRRWKLLELFVVWIASAASILIGLILLLASNGGSYWYSTLLIGGGIVFAVYAYRRVVHYLEWSRDLNTKSYDLTVGQKK